MVTVPGPLVTEKDTIPPGNKSPSVTVVLGVQVCGVGVGVGDGVGVGVGAGPLRKFRTLLPGPSVTIIQLPLAVC